MAPPTIRISQRALSAIESLRESAPPKNTLNGVIEHLLTTVDALPENSKENQQNPPSQTDDRDKLDRLGSVRDSLADKWNEGYEHLKAYKEEHGNLLVPHGYQSPDDYPLGRWVSARRIKRESLTIDQREKLDELGFVWDPSARRWNEGHEHLKAYKEEHGDVLVPNDYTTPDGYKLGSWARDQRAAKDRLSNEQLKKLDALGFVWNLSAHRWNEAYEYLKAYKEEHGDVLVPHGYQTHDGFELGRWVVMQRAKFGGQRDTMQKLYAEFGEQEDKILKAYASLEKEGLVERKSNTYSISSRSYAQALLNDGKKKGWLFRQTDNRPSADNNSVQATRLIIKKRWFGLGLLVRIHDKKSDVRFCYPHDDLIAELETHAPAIFETTSWRDTGQYHWPNIPSDKGKYAFIRTFLAKYQEVSGE